MLRPIPTSLAFVLAAGVLAAPAFAQEMGKMAMNGMPHQKMFSFGLGGGVAVPVSNARDALKNGFNGLGYARVQLPGMPISFGVNVTFQRFDLKDATVSAGGGSTTSGSPGTTDMLGGLGDMKLGLMKGPIQPYVTVGLGAYNLKTDVNTGGSSSSESKTHFGVNGGAGIALRFGPVSGFIQGRIDNVYTDTGGAIDTKSVQLIPVTAGIEF